MSAEGLLNEAARLRAWFKLTSSCGELGRPQLNSRCMYRTFKLNLLLSRQVKGGL